MGLSGTRASEDEPRTPGSFLGAKARPLVTYPPAPRIVHGEGAYEAHLGHHSVAQPLIKLQRSPSFVVHRVDIRGM